MELRTPSSTAQDTLPSQVLNLNNWKLTLPIGTSEKPTEVKQPDLTGFKLDPWFVVNSEGNGVRFRAPVNAPTTQNSNYPRSELREMKDDGKNNASWNTSSGTHKMLIQEAITAVPSYKKHVVAAQIHDSSDDVIVIRLEHPKLWVNVDGKNKYVLNSNYVLGERFTINFIVKDNQTKVYYNGSQNPVYTLNKRYSKAYFKAGAYTQSNCSKEKSSSLCNDNNYGEVIIYHLSVIHE